MSSGAGPHGADAPTAGPSAPPGTSRRRSESTCLPSGSIPFSVPGQAVDGQGQRTDGGGGGLGSGSPAIGPPGPRQHPSPGPWPSGDPSPGPWPSGDPSVHRVATTTGRDPAGSDLASQDAPGGRWTVVRATGSTRRPCRASSPVAVVTGRTRHRVRARADAEPGAHATASGLGPTRSRQRRRDSLACAFRAQHWQGPWSLARAPATTVRRPAAAASWIAVARRSLARVAATHGRPQP